MSWCGSCASQLLEEHSLFAEGGQGTVLTVSHVGVKMTRVRVGGRFQNSRRPRICLPLWPLVALSSNFEVGSVLHDLMFRSPYQRAASLMAHPDLQSPVLRRRLPLVLVALGLILFLHYIFGAQSPLRTFGTSYDVYV
jgi:hypothetical protein